MNYVIIGNGTAATGVIEGIRVVDKNGPITLISSEPYPVYGRPLISYLLLGKTTEEKMLRYRQEDFYEKNGVTPLLGKTATAVDPAGKTVTVDDGTLVPYDKLCIATGSRPFVPPMEGLDQVTNQTSFMTLDDAKKLDVMLGEDGSKRVLIIGAGLIGLKCAEGIINRAKSILAVDMAPRILPNVMLEHPGSIIQKHIEKQGVSFRLNDSAAHFPSPTSATLQSGEQVEFDVLVVAVGVRPNTGLAQIVGCEVNRDILLDGHMQTTVPDIYAAGDCTVSPDISCDTDRILAILPNAYMLGDVERAGIYTSLIRERTPLSSIDFDLIRERPQLMAFSQTERAKKLGGVHVW